MLLELLLHLVGTIAICLDADGPVGLGFVNFMNCCRLRLEGWLRCLEVRLSVLEALIGRTDVIGFFLDFESHLIKLVAHAGDLLVDHLLMALGLLREP